MIPRRTWCWLFLTLLLIAGLAVDLAAEGWSGITPGETTMASLRARYGPPSRETKKKVEGYDTTQWIYEGSKAPVGMKRMTVEFGMLASGQYRSSLVRYFILEPKPRVFPPFTILGGWGVPDRVGEKDGRKSYFYKSGLFVDLDPTGDDTVSMLFSMPQPEPKPVEK